MDATIHFEPAYPKKETFPGSNNNTNNKKPKLPIWSSLTARQEDPNDHHAFESVRARDNYAYHSDLQHGELYTGQGRKELSSWTPSSSRS